MYVKLNYQGYSHFRNNKYCREHGWTPVHSAGGLILPRALGPTEAQSPMNGDPLDFLGVRDIKGDLCGGLCVSVGCHWGWP